MRFSVCLFRKLALLSALLALGAAVAWAPPRAARAENSAAARELGRLLFFEPLLSANARRSCASCHRPEKAFTDHRITARGLRFTTNLTRNTPTLLHVAGQRRFFHDGRAATFGGVVAEVLTSPREFGSCYDTAITRLRELPDYRRQFAAAFGPAADITAAAINAALEAYVLGLTQPSSAYDRARGGGRPLPAEARRGEALFIGAAGCARCHPAPTFRDGRLHALPGGDSVKTPTLRNVALTMPYRADGTAAALPDVLTDAFHQRHAPRPLQAEEVAALLVFLNALTDTAASPLAEPPATLPRGARWPDRPVGGVY